MGVAAESPITVSNQSVTILDYGAGNLTSVRLMQMPRTGRPSATAFSRSLSYPRERTCSMALPADPSPGKIMEPAGSASSAHVANPELKIPEMGWNAVHFDETHPLFRGIPQDTPFYFVHSYYCAPDSRPLVLGTTEYGGMEFCSAAIRGSLAATQFHPERSGEFGLRLFRNFLEWDGKGGTAGC